MKNIRTRKLIRSFNDTWFRDENDNDRIFFKICQEGAYNVLGIPYSAKQFRLRISDEPKRGYEVAVLKALHGGTYITIEGKTTEVSGSLRAFARHYYGRRNMFWFKVADIN